MKIIYPKIKYFGFSPLMLEVKVNDVRKARALPSQEVELKDAVGKEVKLKFGLLASYSFTPAPQTDYMLKSNWFLRNFKICTTATWLIPVIAVNASIVSMQEYYWPVLMILPLGVFLLFIVLFRSGIFKIELDTIPQEDNKAKV